MALISHWIHTEHQLIHKTVQGTSTKIIMRKLGFELHLNTIRTPSPDPRSAKMLYHHFFLHLLLLPPSLIILPLVNNEEDKNATAAFVEPRHLPQLREYDEWVAGRPLEVLGGRLLVVLEVCVCEIDVESSFLRRSD